MKVVKLLVTDCTRNRSALSRRRRSAVVYDKTFESVATPRYGQRSRGGATHVETTRASPAAADAARTIFTAIIAGDATTTESLSVRQLERPTKCRIGQDKCAVIL